MRCLPGQNVDKAHQMRRSRQNRNRTSIRTHPPHGSSIVASLERAGIVIASASTVEPVSCSLRTQRASSRAASASYAFDAPEEASGCSAAVAMAAAARVLWRAAVERLVLSRLSLGGVLCADLGEIDFCAQGWRGQLALLTATLFKMRVEQYNRVLTRCVGHLGGQSWRAFPC
jgi:hypothetical protein